MVEGRDRITAVDEVSLHTPAGAGSERYTGSEELLGQGGMGVVSLVRDRSIGRRVAKKTLRSDLMTAGEARARFIREVQVQGQLEHPAIVPVYDLVLDDDAPPSFTMKSIRGVTLEQILARVRADPAVETTYSRHRLLGAFSTVCLAVDYAHERGVLHRDLKPANIMLGDYGEVYVLDWGIARISDASDLDREQLDVPDTGEAMTEMGTVLGTPGFVAPEQLIAGSGDPDRRCDIYALGAILFELLALEPLHRGSSSEVVEATVEGVDARPSVRAPDRDIAPELDAICERATALAPEDRFQSARALHDAIERVITGERDLELRRTKAREHAERAASAARELTDGTSDGIDARRTAMREVGRALALDPDNAEAARTMVDLLERAPEVAPPEVEEEMKRAYESRVRWMGKIAAATYLGTFGFLPLLLWMGVRQPLVIAAGFVALGGAAALCLKNALAGRAPVHLILAALALSALAFMFLGRMFGPLIMVPAVVAINATGYSVFLDRRWRLLILGLSSAALLVPLGLELVGILAPSYTGGAGFSALPRAIELPYGPTLALLTLSSVASIIVGTLIVGHIRDRLAAAEQRIYTYAWHMSELVGRTAERR